MGECDNKRNGDWSHLQRPVVTPINSTGSWKTTNGCTVYLDYITPERVGVRLEGNFDKKSCQEISKFYSKLAEQLN